MTVDVGTRVAGRYEVLALLAEGGMSRVYRARTPEGQVVALKVLRDAYAADREFIERFIREARAVQALDHPHVVRVLDSGRDGDVYFIAMEYVDGEDLKRHLQRVGPLEPADAERIALAVCAALDYAHGQGIVHRDVKPQNILLARDGTVKVADFGIARALAAITITQTGTVLGTVHYLSPEQARGAPVGRASDLYALGVVLFEMLTGRLPFEGDSPIAVALKHLHEPPPSARAVNPRVPRRLDGIIRKAMAKRREDRYATAREMAADLRGETALWEEVLGDDAPTRTFALEVRRRRRVTPTVPVAAAVLVAVLGGLWAGWRAVSAYLNVPEVDVPDLVGRSLLQAEQIARQQGLVVEVAERAYSATVPQDVILAQHEPPGKRVKQGRRIGVVVSLGPQLVTVPDVVRQPVQAAQLALESARLRVGALQEGYDDVVKPGFVIRQDPPAGARVQVDSPVTLVISRGPTQVEMPALVGRTLAEARRVLEERGLVIAHARIVPVADVAPGVIVEQSPAAGVLVRPGQTAITVAVAARPGEEAAPPQAPVVTVEPQPVPTPVPSPAVPTPAGRPSPGATPGAPPAAAPSPGLARRTRVQVVVPEGPAAQDVKIVVIDEKGVRTVYQAPHAPGDRIEQFVSTQGYTIIQVYIDNRLVQELRP
jgi:beta-lactam-binding protein with PASTA domain/tRNA A-37 threonylcarbamoyl transferase component Bud32